MYRHSLNLFNLGNDVEDTLVKYEYDYQNLKNYVAAQIDGSVDINLYSVLLKKPNRHTFIKANENIQSKAKEDYSKLSEYTIQRIYEELKIR